MPTGLPLEYWFEAFWSLVAPRVDLIPEIVPSPEPVGPFAHRLAVFEAEIDHTGKVPCHLISPSGVQP